MPHKDPIAAKASKRAYYLAHKEQWAESKAKSKAKLRVIALEKKQAEANKPKEVMQRACVDCAVDITNSYTSKHGMRCKSCVAKYHKAYRAANAERISENKKQWAIKNADHKAEQDRLYAQRHPEKRTLARKKWSEANPGEDRAAKAKNHAARIKRTPTWLSEDDEWMIAQAYELAALRTKLFGFSWHVDHVIPLNGKKVSGLHVPTNLQVIPWRDNLRKGNRMEVANA
jgi:hypothetical protein